MDAAFRIKNPYGVVFLKTVISQNTDGDLCIRHAVFNLSV